MKRCSREIQSLLYPTEEERADKLDEHVEMQQISWCDKVENAKKMEVRARVRKEDTVDKSAQSPERTLLGA